MTQAEWEAATSPYRRARTKRGETMGECADRLGIGVITLSAIERNTIEPDATLKQQLLDERTVAEQMKDYPDPA